jgi:polyphosphate glucokinase
MQVLGIDIGGSGIKGAVVDTSTGEFMTDKFRLPTPDNTSPHKIIPVIHKMVSHFDWHGPIGVAIPESVRNGIVLSTWNLDPSWQDVNAGLIFSELTDNEVVVINDADAAGIAELRFGAGKQERGVIMILTIGTGVGTALFYNGTLIPNTDLGKLEIRGLTAEERASETSRLQEGVKRKVWAKRIEMVLSYYEKLFHPDLFIISGGVSNKADKVLPFIEIRTRIVAASFLNNAGIVGTALNVSDMLNSKREFNTLN